MQNGRWLLPNQTSIFYLIQWVGATRIWERIMKIFREMLFLQGYSNRPQELVDVCKSSQDATRRRTPEPSGQSLLKTFLLLGGRPMHAGHNFDFDEETDYTALPPKTAAVACEYRS